MKKLHLCLLFSLALFTASSQKVYFVYVQTESEQPFFVRMNEKTYSSSASGYVILSKLHDSSYSFSIGFPQNKWPEQNFTVSVNRKDHGYLLKNFAEKGWGLFDLQTLSVQMAVTGKASIEEKPGTENKDVSAFTDILAKAADDPSLKEKPVPAKIEEKKAEVVVQEVVKEEPKAEIKEPVVTKPVEVVEVPVVKKEEPLLKTKEIVVARPVDVVEVPVAKKEEHKVEAKETVTTKPVETNEQPAVKTEEPKIAVKETVVPKPVEVTEQPVDKLEVPKAETKEQPVIKIEEAATSATGIYKTSQVKKWSESSTTEGFGLVFIDDYDNGIKDTIRLIIPNPKPVNIPAVVKEEVKEEKKFIETVAIDTAATTAIKSESRETPVIKPASNNKCAVVAAENDFFKLRKQMAAAKSDEDMIGEARKHFKTKCFSTAQIKNLSSMFLNDEGKYKFFDAAYIHVSDAENFNGLQTTLTEEYYINRFRAMLRN